MITVRRGEILPPETLLKNLLRLHYEPDFSANRAGSFCRRGGLIEIWPTTTDLPIRLTYDSDTIETITTFDFATKKTKSALDEITIVKSDLPHTRPILAMLAELRPGDYVVHLDHGIGQFKGVEYHKVNGGEREYLGLAYAEGDRLLVPIELADKVDRYVGGTVPELHRLSASNWYQVVLRVQADAAVFARELLEIYAKRAVSQAPVMRPHPTPEQALAESFPFEVTPDQQKAIDDILNDLGTARPMDRVLVGDVGFGKTEVAIRAALRVVKNGYQVAVLAPTTILAQQHFDTFSSRLKKFKVKIGLLTRFQSKEEQNATLARLNPAPPKFKIKERDLGPKTYPPKPIPSIDIIIGTHRLLGRDVAYRDLGLVILDEEQKFGVRQKEHFKKLRSDLHVLSLSATPIPRTLQLALGGMRQISVIQTAPEGRLPVATHVGPSDANLVREAITREVARRGQVYYVHNRVETITAAAVALASLLKDASQPIRLGIAHGQMPENELASVMHAFDTGKLDVLVCSTIIESGLDLSNVNTLIIDDATRFGLATLYQLRGRIGRADRQGYAYLFYPQKLKDQKKAAEGEGDGKPNKKMIVSKADARLGALLSLTHLGAGPELAMRDLELRGAGAILGRKQHGHVKAVGLGTYLRLLEGAVTELQTGTRKPDVPDVIVDLGLAYGIPKTLEPSESRRILLYQQLAHATTQGDLDRTWAQLGKRYGDRFRADINVQNLFWVLRTKLAVQDARLKRVAAHTGRLGSKVTLEALEKFTPQQVNALMDHDPHWEIKNELATIDRDKLGDDWLKNLGALLADLSV